MGKTVTFSFSSTKFEGTEATETLTFEQLGIDENHMDNEALKKVIDEIFQVWIRDKLNISYSIVVDEDKRT